MQKIKRFLRHQRLEKQISKILQVSELSFIKDSYFTNLITQIKCIISQNRYQITQVFVIHINKNIYNPKSIIRILLIINQSLRENLTTPIRQSFIQILFYICTQLNKDKHQHLNKIDAYLKIKFCIPYATYLIKAYQKQVDKKQLPLFLKKDFNNQEQQFLDHLDFSIFNQITEILKFNKDFHQMGRYYSDHQYIINVFLQMLRQFKVYFAILKSNVQRTIKLNIKGLSEQQKQKIFIYLNEVQRIVNKMNSFYYNKYLYYYINQMIDLKIQLPINEEFNKLLDKQTKRQIKTQNNLHLTYNSLRSSKNKQQTYDIFSTIQSNRYKENQVSLFVETIMELNSMLQHIQT